MDEGADRLEVCGDLDVGGVTPPADLWAHARGLGVPCVVMARPVGGRFTLTDSDVNATVADAERMLAEGPGGVVFGGLDRDGRVHRDLVRRLVALAGAQPTVFHRAFDHTPDLLESLDTLIDLGVTRVLSAGGRGRAMEGAGHLASLVHRAAGRIEILAGGGVRADHAQRLVDATGVQQLHARATLPGVIAALRAAVP